MDMARKAQKSHISAALSATIGCTSSLTRHSNWISSMMDSCTLSFVVKPGLQLHLDSRDVGTIFAEDATLA